jgi:cytochrome c5
MLRSLMLFTAVVLILIASASAPARSAQDAGQSATAKKVSPEAMAKAKKVYNLDCALCHGPAGDGKTDLAKDMQLGLADWTDPKSLSSQSDDALFDVIRKGKGKMPPEDTGRATNDEIRGLVIYVRKFAKEGTTAPATEQPAAAPAQTPAPTPPASPSN